MLSAEPFKHPSQHLFRRVPIHFENIHQPVRIRLRLGHSFKQHPFLHGEQRIDPLKCLSPGSKVRHHGFKFLFAPLRFSEVCRRHCRSDIRRQVLRDFSDLRQDPVRKAACLIFSINVLIEVHKQPEAAAFCEAVYGNIGAI